MSSGRLFFALVAGYVGIVLWFAAYGDSLEGVAGLRARLRRGRSLRSGFVAVLAVVLVVGLGAVALASVRNLGSTRRAEPRASRTTHLADPASLRPSRALSPPAAVARHPKRVHTAKAPAHAQSHHPANRPVVVSNLVNVSARVPAASGTTTSTSSAAGSAPAPLPAPAQSSGPSPLAAP